MSPAGTVPHLRESQEPMQAPAKALLACGTDGLYVKRIIGLPGDT
jgi:hypothetical protein